MKSALLFSLLVLLPFLAFTRSTGKSLSLVNGCKIFELNGRWSRNFPGEHCLFLDDGSFISATESGIKRFSNKGEALWTLPGNVHHQINFSNDRQRILALSSEVFEKRPGERRRLDTFLVVSLEGQILFKASARALLEQKKLKGLDWTMTPMLRPLFHAEKEDSHFNSIYEVPELSGPAAPYLKTGNIVVNSKGLGVFVLTSDLRQVLHFEAFPFSYEHRVHDVQIKKNGHFLFFNNYVLPAPARIKYSAIQEYDPLRKKLVFEFSPSPKGAFYSVLAGSVQELDEDLVLFTHVLTGTYVYSRARKNFEAVMASTCIDEEKFVPSQQVKAVDLSAFLANWKGPK